jgi:hypothetical protein
MELVDDEQDARVSRRTGRPGTTIGPVRSAGSLQVTPKIRNTDQNASVMELVDIGDSKSASDFTSQEKRVKFLEMPA